jgi:hypothetical protein
MLKVAKAVSRKKQGRNRAGSRVRDRRIKSSWRRGIMAASLEALIINMAHYLHRQRLVKRWIGNLSK